MEVGTGCGRRLRVLAFGLLLSSFVLAVGAASATATVYDTVSLSASSGSVAIGSSLTYTVLVGPGGGTPAIMTDQVNGMTSVAVSTTSGSCSQSAGLVTCQTSLAQATTVTISGIVTAPAGTLLHDVAIVDSQAGQPVMSATAEADVQVTGGTIPPGPGSGTPDLVTSIVAPSTVAAGSPITYTLVVGNQGTGNANGVNVVETLPSTLASPSLGSVTSLFLCGISGNTLNCSGGRIDAGAVGTITVTGVAPAGGPLVDQAVVDPFDTIPESNYNNNTSQTTTVVAPSPAANALSVGLTASPSPDVAQGSTLTYTTTVKNTQPPGGGSITDIGFMLPTQGLDPTSLNISFALPSGQSQSVAQACGVNGSIAVCFSADNDAAEVNLAPQQVMTITVSGTVVATPAAKIFGSVRVIGGLASPNANALSTTATTTTQVKPAIDLSITKASLPATVQAAAPLTYRYVVGNSGLSSATGVVIRDPLPAAMQPPFGSPPAYTFSFSYSSPFNSFTCAAVDPTNPVLTCTETLAGQSAATIDIHMIAPEATGTYTSVVQVDPNNTIPESDKNNNSATATTTVTTGVDLAVTGCAGTSVCGQTVNFDPVVTNGTLTYTITVANLGTQDTTGVVVDDTLPAGTTFRYATADHNFTCSNQNGTVHCAGGIISGTYTHGLPSGPNTIDTATITIAVFAPNAPGTVTNIVRVNSQNTIPEYDSPDANNISYLTTNVVNGCPSGTTPPTNCGNYIDLSIPTLTSTPTPSGSPGDPVVPSGTNQYQMTVENTGTQPAFQVEVTDTLPAGATFRSATGTGGFTCSASGQVVDCTGGEVDAGGGAQTITINVFAPANPGTYTDQAIVDPHNQIPEANESNNTASVSTIVSTTATEGTWINLTMSMTQIPESLDGTSGDELPGGLIKYKLVVANTGQEQATGVVVDDTLPSNATFVSAIDSNAADGFTCTQAASPPGTVHCMNGVVNAHGSDEIDVVVAAPNASGVSVGINKAVVNPDETIPESTYTDNTDQSTSIPVSSPIDLTISQDGPTSASQNQTTDYKLTVMNSDANSGGTGAFAHQVAVHDPLPPGLIVENLTSDPNTFGCQVSENPVNVIDCTGELDTGKSVTIDAQVFVTAADSTTFTNEACVNPNHTILESNFNNNCSTTTTAVNTPDLALSQSAATSPVSPGQNEIYTIGVSNTGTGAIPAGQATVTDSLPTGLTFVQANGTNGWTCTKSSNTVTCQNGNAMNPGDTTSIKLTTTVLTGATGPIANTASVTSTATGFTADSAPGDDSDTTSVNLNGTGIDLVAQSLKATPDPVDQGHVLTYTGVVSNNGVQDSGSFTITQTLPPTGDWVSASLTDVASHGFTCTYDAGSNSVNCTGDLVPGTSTTVTTQLQIGSAAPTGAITSTIAANPTKAVVESDYTNNSQTAVTTIAAAACNSPCIQVVGSNLVGTPSPVAQGGTLTYAYSVANAGDQTAHQVLILFTLDTNNFDIAAPPGPAPTATVTDGFTCTTGFSTVDNDWIVGCYQQNPTPAAPCTFTVNSSPSVTPFSFDCSSGKQSNIVGKAGVVVSITAAVDPAATVPSEIDSSVAVTQATSDNNFGGEPSANSAVQVVAPGPASRGSASTLSAGSHHGATCTTVAVSRKSDKHRQKVTTSTCGRRPKTHKHRHTHRHRR